MTSEAAEQQERELLLEQLETLCQEAIPAADRAAAIDFLRAYYGGTPTEVLDRRHPPDLLERGLAHFALLQAPPPREGRLELVEQADGRGWLLRNVVADKPFLVDTLLLTARRFGASIRWLVHPVLPIERDAQGRYQQLGEQGRPESLIQFEFGGVDPARMQALHDALEQVSRQLDAVVEDYLSMRERLAEQIDALAEDVPGIDPGERSEIAEFLRWLDSDHFTFLGFLQSQSSEDEGLAVLPGSGLGLWRGEEPEALRIAPTSEMAKYARSRRPLIITTTEGRSPIHHDEYCDVVVIKQYTPEGEPRGTVRFLGLFSSEVYNTLPRRIPLIRRKIELVMARIGLREGGHGAKQLRDILDNLPRDELFQSSVRELTALATGVQTVREAQQLRLFLRRDRYGRFFSCLIYQHRDRYSSSARRAMSQALLRLLGGADIEHDVSFQRDGLARIHLTIRTPGGATTPLTVRELESRLVELATRWEDAVAAALVKLLPDAQAELLTTRWLRRVPVSYREEVLPQEAATDLQYLQMIDRPGALRVRMLPHGERLDIKLYGRGEVPSLSLLLPRLEHFGLQVLAQHPYLFGEGEEGGWVQHFDVALRSGSAPSRERRADFEEAFGAVWEGALEDDGLNALVLSAGLDWREIALVRTLVKYAQQTGLPFSQGYIESLLCDHADFVAATLALFRARFEPGGHGAGEAEAQQAQALRDAVESADADRLLACLLAVVQATLRTNFYQRDAQDAPKRHISLKIRSDEVPELPRPRPMVETFVYAPEVEGVHLRGGPVARGGLRWSDRREDFRTEVLGLVKAQMVKNAVIVPQGAKGGFVVKRAVDRSDRAAWQQAGVDCYQTFIRGLLDITDNLVDGEVVPPPQVRRHDGDDPYLVVAADKGTATFSDIANAISADYNFWLGDAFASGGSAGYDHKMMGITARGAWESVKRHFAEMGHDSQQQDFTVVGVGDMAGDVFGNGMLLSRHIRLVAAFNHLHIFIDPEPDAASSYAERERLFRLPRSSWTDYDSERISEGGGIYERRAKSITLSPQARAALGIEEEKLAPDALIRAILSAPVDLFWNGGIGTYVKASDEAHVEVGDRANDALRINADQLRAKVVGEGGNLGLTQRGRVQAALRGVRVITDFNDNAGGVNSSDREVNLKIPLNAQVRAGALELEARNALLESMTEDLADKVLRDSDLQTQGICMQARSAPQRLAEHAALIRMLERHAGLDRALEFLPDEEGLAERRGAGLGLTRPELAVLVSYAKLDLFAAVVDSDLPEDPALEGELLGYFPEAARAQHTQALQGHRLRHEIIATVTTNRLVNRMGPSFARRIAEEQHRPLPEVVRAWLAASRVLEAEARCQRFEACAAPLEAVYAALDRLAGLCKHLTLWLLAQHSPLPAIETLAEIYAEPLHELEADLEALLAPGYASRHQEHYEQAQALGLPEAEARLHAHHHVLGSGADIAWLSARHGLALDAVAAAYFALGSGLELPWVLEQINSLPVKNRWQAMARNQLRAEAYAIHRGLVDAALGSGEGLVPERVAHWEATHEAGRAQVLHSQAELETMDAADSAGLTVLLGQLRRLIA